MDGGKVTLEVGFSLAKGTKLPQGMSAGNSIPKPFINVPQDWSLSLPYGTAAGQFQAVAFIENSLAASGSVTIDLYAGTLLDVFGDPMPLRTLVGVAVQQIVNADGSPAASGLVVGNAGSNPHPLWLSVGTATQLVDGLTGVPLVMGSPAGKAVTATARNVLLTNPDSANKATYRLFVAGRL